MNARTRFRHWLDSEITPTLAAAGYVRRGHNYERATSDTLLMVAFQMSRSSSADDVEFNVYGGVCSYRLLEYDSALVSRSPGKSIDLLDCQVQIPLFYLLGERVERWWSLDPRSMLEMGVQFRSWIASLLIPELEARQADVALRDEYLWQRRAGELGPIGLGHLLHLMKAIGPASEISGIEQELVGAGERRLARNLEIMAQERVDR
jgi:hypothetical protein